MSPPPPLAVASQLAALVTAVRSAEVRVRELEDLASAATDARHLVHQAELVEVACTDTLLELDRLLDAAEGAERDGVRDAMRRIKEIAGRLAALKEAALDT